MKITNSGIFNSASFIFTLHLAEKWQRHPAADLKGYKPLLQFLIPIKVSTTFISK